jgi:hypothetical protein
MLYSTWRFVVKKKMRVATKIFAGLAPTALYRLVAGKIRLNSASQASEYAIVEEMLI